MFNKASIYAVGTPVNANTTQCITADQHPPTWNKILLHLNEQLSSFHSLHLQLQHSLTACLRSELMWTKGMEGDVGFSCPSFAADLHVCSWTFFTLKKNPQTLLPLPAPLFSLCPCYMPHCLLFYSRWMLPPQLFVCFYSFYLCDSLQLLWTLVFIIPPFPYKTLFLLSSAPVCCPSFCTSLHIFIFVLYPFVCLFSHLCNEKSSTSLPIDNCGKRWKLWRGVMVNLGIPLARLSWPLAGHMDISWFDRFSPDLVNSNSYSTPSLSLV